MDAPHDNPLDPNFAGNIRGKVLSRSSYGIGRVEILVPFCDLITYTDTSGNFGMYIFSEEPMWVYFTHEDYSPESVTIAPKRGEVDTLMVCMNGLPYFVDFTATAHNYERNWPPDPLYFCFLSASANDIDGEVDIESVWIEIPDLLYTKRLVYNSQTDEFVYTLLADELPGQNLEVLIGKDIFFNVADKNSTSVQSLPCYIFRIIHYSPDIIFPAGGNDIIKTDTTFIWHKYTSGFSVRYHGEIVKIIGGGPGGVAFSFDNAEQNDTTFDFKISYIDLGEYYWTLEVIDDLGNSARTKEERFFRE